MRKRADGTMESTELLRLGGRRFESTVSGWDDSHLHKVLLAIKRERPGAWPSPQPGEHGPSQDEVDAGPTL